MRRCVEGHRQRQHEIVGPLRGGRALEPFAATRRAVTEVAGFQAAPGDTRRSNGEYSYSLFDERTKLSSATKMLKDGHGFAVGMAGGWAKRRSSNKA